VGGGKQRQRIGGVRGISKPAPSAARKVVGGVRHMPLPDPAPVVGGVVTVERGTSSAHRGGCCDGKWISGMWVHDHGCPNMTALWRQHGYETKDWWCAFGCEGQETGHAITHCWDCAFWREYADRTPF
jgi:hypothetical protein